jgi:hypothetical protein
MLAVGQSVALRQMGNKRSQLGIKDGYVGPTPELDQKSFAGLSKGSLGTSWVQIATVPNKEDAPVLPRAYRSGNLARGQGLNGPGDIGIQLTHGDPAKIAAILPYSWNLRMPLDKFRKFDLIHHGIRNQIG